MRLLISWVRDFVDVTAPADAIADRLALRGFEVAAVEPLGGGDAVIDFEVTANRPDCLSVLGFAREIGTAYDLPVRLPSADPGARVALAALPIAAAAEEARHTGASAGLQVSIEDAELCPRYAAAVAELTPATSPAWLSERLQAAGIRPISPVVDITNYVAVELGHPMHAFDLERLADRSLRIRRAAPGETLTTLDGVARTLEADMLVIADSRRAQAIAGVMGGGESEVSGRTRTVAFESAYFKPASVRRTSKRLNLKTEASSRFERGADIDAPVLALQRAAALLHAIGAGRTSGMVIDCYPAPRGPRPLTLRRQRLELLLGMSVPGGEVERILRGLGLTVTAGPEGWAVIAPTFRVDLLREVDLIEEVGRHYGFERLEPSFPPMTRAAEPLDARLSRDHAVRRTLIASGLTEAVTFGITESAALAAFAGGALPAIVAVANPLSAKFDALRPSLVPGLVDAVAHNRRHGQRNVALFEIGSRFTPDGESRGVALAWTGGAGAEHWSAPARDVDLFDVKGAIEQLCGVLEVEPRLERATRSFLVEGQAAEVIVADTPVGVLGLVAPEAADSRGVPRQDKVFVAEMNLDLLAALSQPREPHVRPLPRHPAVVRDLSVVVANSLPAAIIRGTIHAAAAGSGGSAAPLASVGFFDRYQGKGVAEGSVSVSVRLTFQAADRTLTDAEVQQSVDTILAALVREHGAVQR
jgi:phenylalanyl-tRNA synthetase beta chain